MDGVARNAGSGGWTQMLQGMSWSFLGLAAVRIWIQCIMYGRYVASDNGVLSVLINLSRVVFTLILVILVAKVGLPRLFDRWLSWLSVTAMSLASVLFFVNTQFAVPLLQYAACILAAFGIVWGGGMWMRLFLRLDPPMAFICAFLSLALGSFGGFVLGTLPLATGYMVSIFMPTLSFVMLRHAMVRVGVEDFYTADPKPVDTVYDGEPPSSFLRLLIGLALFMFAVGVSRGFPFGEAIDLSIPFQLLHQLGVVAVSLLCIRWCVVDHHGIASATFWRFEVVMVAIGVMLLATLTSWGFEGGAVAIAIANSFSLGILWYTCYDIARHSSRSPYVTLGVCWAVFLASREVGRWAIIGLALADGFVIVMVAVMICLLAVSIAVLMGDDVPRLRPLFEGLGSRGVSGGARIDETDGVPARSFVSSASGKLPPVVSVMGGSITQGTDQTAGDMPSMQRYALTEREVQVIELILQGKSKAEVGEVLFISENTVRGHVKNVYEKMGVNSKRALAARYRR